MALFKIFKGKDKAKLDTMPMNDGYAYYNTNNGLFYIDAEYPSGNNSNQLVLDRRPINAQRAFYDSHNSTEIYKTYIKDIKIENSKISYITGDDISHSITQSKIYTEIIGTANNWAGATFFFGNIKPQSWYTSWRIKYRIRTYVPGKNGYDQIADVIISGDQDVIRSYSSFNTVGPYYPAYYHVVYRMKKAGFDNNYGHALGIRFYSAYSPTDVNYKRTIEIDFYDSDNCTFEFFDNCLLYQNIPGTGSTNYNTYTEINYCSNGLQEVGDSNDVNYQNRIYYTSSTAAEQIYRYQILLRTRNQQLLPVSSANNDTSTIDKIYSSTPFDPFGEIYYYNTTTTIAPSGNVGNSVLYRQVLADLRYSFGLNNTANYKLIARQPVYLTATPQADGTAILTKIDGSQIGPLAQTLPSTEDGLIYIYLGQVYEDTNPYRVELTLEHPIYWYKDGSVRLFTVNNYTLPKATDSVLGGIKTGYSASEKNYAIKVDSNGNAYVNVPWTDTTYTFDGTYNASTNKVATVSTVTNAINNLDVSNITGFGAGKTLSALSETNGKISASFQNISITKSQISDFPTSMTPSSHTHGNIQNSGTLQSNDITIASGDKLVVTDSSDSAKIARTSISFDGSTTTKALTPKGTWEPFNNYSLPLAANGTRGGIQIGYSESGTNYAVKLSGEKAYVTVPWTDKKVTQSNQTGNGQYRILLSHGVNDTEETDTINKSGNLTFNPSTRLLSVGGNISTTGDLTLTGNAYLNNETYANSLTTGSLLVNGNTNFIQIPTAPTPADSSNDTSVATTAFVKKAFSYNDAMVFMGAIAGGSSMPAANKGHTYRVSSAGKINGQNVEVGDTLICTEDNTAAGNTTNWIILQTNIDGAVVGPASSTTGHIAVFTGNTGKGISDSGKAITTTAPASGSADTTIPTSKAVWSAISGASGYGKTGTVTSVQVQASSPLQSSTNTAQSTSLNTTISFTNQNANTVLAGPSSGSATAPSFRALVAADIPKVNNAITADKLGASTVGSADRPIYLSSGTATQTTYRMSGTNATATTARAITEDLETGNWYVNGTNSTDLYSQGDGVAYVEKYNDSWIHEIYGDYRTGQIAVRGKNSGAWQAWRKILDSGNYTDYTVKKDGTGASGIWGINITGSATKATQDESGNNIKSSYASSFSISDHTITLKNKNGGSLGTVTVPDNNTTYTFANGTDGSFTVTPSNGSAQTVNIGKPTTAGVADVANSVAWDKVTGKPSSFTPSSHSHSEIVTVGDKRSEATTPNSYSNKIIFQGLKTNSSFGSPSTDSYSYVIGLRGWSDSSGGDSHELAFNNTGLYWRHGATTSWGSWNRIYTTANKPTKSDVGLENVENTALSTWAGSSNISIVGTLSSGTVPWARLSNIPTASDSALGLVKVGTTLAISSGILNQKAIIDSNNAKTYGNNSQQTPSHGGTFNIPYFTIDTYGRITAAGTTTVKLPSDNNTDTLVKQTVKTDNVEYKILTTTSASPTSGNAAEAAYSTDITINPNIKAITSPNYKVTSNATITYNTANGCLEIIVA